MAKYWLGLIIRLMGCGFLILLTSGCFLRPDINIGLVAELTGKQSDLGVQLRNGIQMAVEEINTSGGIQGRHVNLIIKDYADFSKNMESSVEELIDQKVVTILGPVTSDHALEIYSSIEANGMVLLSPIVATSELSGLRDHFFRTFVSTDFQAMQMAEYIYYNKNITKISVIYDSDNLSYSETIFKIFSTTFTALGGEVVAFQEYSSATEPDFETYIEKLNISNTEAVFIVTSPTDAALIAQEISLMGWHPALFGASWTQGPALIEMGGMTVEGMEAITPFNINTDSKTLESFVADYQSQNGEQPLYSAISGYETMMFLAQALRETKGQAKGLENALVSLQDFQGLSSTINLDEFGDTLRPLIIQKIVDGRFVTIEFLSPES